MKRSTAKALDGKALSRRMLDALPARIAAVSDTRGEAPLLAILAFSGDMSSEAYLKSKLSACRTVGIETSVQSLPGAATEDEVARVLDDLANDPHVDGILVEVPVPRQLHAPRLTERIPAEKDVEGVTAVNYGRFFSARTMDDIESVGALVPCTAGALISLLRESGVDPRGRRAVVVGRSNIVGKPAAHLLTCLDATVTLCHSRTPDLEAHLRQADVVVTAAGRSRLVRGDMLKPGCVVLDAGMNYEDGAVRGDVDYESASRVASFVTPVPGGVGPVTIATLLGNTVLAAERRTRARLGR